MRRWNIRGLHVSASKRLYYRRLLPHTRSFSSTPPHSALGEEIHSTEREPRYAVFRRIPRPEGDADAWTSSLEGALPPHLRSPTLATPPLPLAAVDVAEILLAAQYPDTARHEPLDLLFHLGFKQDRWAAVVWLIKKLVDKYAIRDPLSSRLANSGPVWRNTPSLEELTTNAIELKLDGITRPTTLERTRNLDDLLGGYHPEYLSREQKLQHDALGQVWRTLGLMTQACSGGEVRPEVLQIIAYLHHREVMPISIYDAKPHWDKSAIQQPPILSLLHDRILTSLSDAAWRAHEKLVIEEAEANGSEFAAFRPEIPASVYRVRVAGLKPEVWMELVLWSCLHGGWIVQGIEILRTLVRDGSWSPYAWRDSQEDNVLDPQQATTVWRPWERLFKPRESISNHRYPGPPRKVEQTVSGEVVNAYIEALANIVSVGVGSRGLPIQDVVTTLSEFRRFLLHAKQTLSSGTWDSLILRLLDAQSVRPEHDSGMLQPMVSLSSGFGQGLRNKNTDSMPSYVLDGSLALQGVLHRALYGQIMAGSLEGALEIFAVIQKRADIDKSRAMFDFFGSRRKPGKTHSSGQGTLFQALSNQNLFTSNIIGIEYPGVEVQIPPQILGKFLDLVTGAQEYGFARWLLFNNDMDGPLIPVSLYTNPFVQPAIARFAAETESKDLLAILKSADLSRASLQAIFDIQINALRLDLAARILTHMSATKRTKWSASNLANLAKIILILMSKSAAGDVHSQSKLREARAMFTSMVQTLWDPTKSRTPARVDRIRSVVIVLVAADPSLAQVYGKSNTMIGRHHKLSIDPPSFNAILEGVVATHNSAAGRNLLGIFWPHAARTGRSFGVTLDRKKVRMDRMQRFRPRVLESAERQRIVVRTKSGELVAYGVFVPDFRTISIILRKALQELEDARKNASASNNVGPELWQQAVDGAERVDVSPKGMVVWAVKRLAELPYVHGGLVAQLDEFLAKHGLDEARTYLPEVYQHVLEESEEDESGKQDKAGEDVSVDAQLKEHVG